MQSNTYKHFFLIISAISMNKPALSRQFKNSSKCSTKVQVDIKQMLMVSIT